jgi:hypothetical protein
MYLTGRWHIAEAMKLAFSFRDANGNATGVGSHMTNTDSNPFMDFVPAISLRENERACTSARDGTRIGINPPTVTRRSPTRTFASD